MIKKLAALGFTAALVLSPVAVFAQAAAPVDTTPPAAGAPAPEMKPMHHHHHHHHYHHVMHKMHHMEHKMKKMEKKMDAEPPK
jgi:hypothetical protein